MYDSVSRERPGREAQGKQHGALSCDELNDLVRSGPERAANAELAFASRHLKRKKAIQTYGGEDEPDYPER